MITGEGYLDEQSFEGKVVGGVQELAMAAGKPVGAVVGDAAPEVAARIDHVSLVDAYGEERAMNEPLWCIERAAATLLERLTPLAGGADSAGAVESPVGVEPVVADVPLIWASVLPALSSPSSTSTVASPSVCGSASDTGVGITSIVAGSTPINVATDVATAWATVSPSLYWITVFSTFSAPSVGSAMVKFLPSSAVVNALATLFWCDELATNTVAPVVVGVKLVDGGVVIGGISCAVVW